MGSLGKLVRVEKATPLEGFQMQLDFEDGTSRVVDLEAYLKGPIFEAVRNDASLFRSVRVEAGTIAWPNGADIDPDVLYYGLKPAWMEEKEVAQRR